MNNAAVKQQRNMTLECCRMVAALFVVFVHAPFPGEFGSLITCLSRYAVPMFFAISGWYSYGVDYQKLQSRLVRTLFLEWAAIVLYFVWSFCNIIYWGGSLREALEKVLPGALEMRHWLFRNVVPFAGHLWYLSAAVWCYAFIWLYVRLFGKRNVCYVPVYLMSGVLLALHFAMGEFAWISGISVEYTVYRNAWFLGIPMFGMGIFLRQYSQKILKILEKRNRILVGILLGGILLSILEWRIFGEHILPVGAVIQAAVLLLLTAAYPAIPEKYVLLQRAAPMFGFLSTAVYILHLMIIDLYLTFGQWRMERYLGFLEGWVQPVLIAAASVMAALAAYGLRWVWNKV